RLQRYDTAATEAANSAGRMKDRTASAGTIIWGARSRMNVKAMRPPKARWLSGTGAASVAVTGWRRHQPRGLIAIALIMAFIAAGPPGPDPRQHGRACSRRGGCGAGRPADPARRAGIPARSGPPGPRRSDEPPPPRTVGGDRRGSA